MTAPAVRWPTRRAPSGTLYAWAIGATKAYDGRLRCRPAARHPAPRLPGAHDGSRRIHVAQPANAKAAVARRTMDAVHAEPRFQGRSADRRQGRRDVLLERSRREDHRRIVGAVLCCRRSRPQGDRRGGAPAALRSRFRRPVPACAPEELRARVTRRRAHAGRPQSHLFREFRLGSGGHGDEGRARLPPGTRTVGPDDVRVARARVSRRQLRRRRAVRHHQQPAQVRSGHRRRRAHAAHAPEGEPVRARPGNARRRLSR